MTLEKYLSQDIGAIMTGITYRGPGGLAYMRLIVAYNAFNGDFTHDSGWIAINLTESREFVTTPVAGLGITAHPIAGAPSYPQPTLAGAYILFSTSPAATPQQGAFTSLQYPNLITILPIAPVTPEVQTIQVTWG